MKNALTRFYNSLVSGEVAPGSYVFETRHDVLAVGEFVRRNPDKQPVREARSRDDGNPDV